MKKILLIIALFVGIAQAQWINNELWYPNSDITIAPVPGFVIDPFILNAGIFDTTSILTFYEPEVTAYRSGVLNDGGSLYGLNRFNSNVYSDRNLGLYDSQVLKINGRLGNKVDGSNYVSKAYDASSLYQNPIQSTGANQPQLVDFAYKFSGSQYLTLTPDSIQISTGRNVGSLDMNGYQKISDTMDYHFESQTLNLSANLVTNGTFDADANWEKLDASITIADGVMHFTNTPAFQVGRQIGVLTIGRKYKIVFAIKNYSSGAIKFTDGIGGAETLSANGTYTYYFVAQYTNVNFMTWTGGDLTSLDIDDVTVQEVESDWVGYGNNNSYISGLTAHTGTYSNGITSTGAGDSTTNYTKLAPNKYESIEAGKKYTFETWVWVDVACNISLSIGDIKKTWTISDDSTWVKIAYNFLATSQTAGQDIRLYANQASTLLIDDVGLYEYYPFSYSGWFKASTSGRILEQFDAVALKGIILHLNNGRLGLQKYAPYPFNNEISTTQTYTDNNWHFFTIVIDAVDTCKIYVDNALITSSVSFQQLGNTDLPDPYYIAGSTASFNGSIGSLTIHRNKTLTLAEHQALYQRGR